MSEGTFCRVEVQIMMLSVDDNMIIIMLAVDNDMLAVSF